jgi:hypothetical protein
MKTQRLFTDSYFTILLAYLNKILPSQTKNSTSYNPTRQPHDSHTLKNSALAQDTARLTLDDTAVNAVRRRSFLPPL